MRTNIFAYILSIALLFTLASCSNGGNSPSVNKNKKWLTTTSAKVILSGTYTWDKIPEGYNKKNELSVINNSQYCQDWDYNTQTCKGNTIHIGNLDPQHDLSLIFSGYQNKNGIKTVNVIFRTDVEGDTPKGLFQITAPLSNDDPSAFRLQPLYTPAPGGIHAELPFAVFPYLIGADTFGQFNSSVPREPANLTFTYKNDTLTLSNSQYIMHFEKAKS